MKKFKWLLVVLLSLITIFVYFDLLKLADDNLFLAFLDIGQGDAIFFRTPSGHQVLFDAGENNQVLTHLNSFLPFFRRDFDLLILSHPHLDHYGGFFSIINTYQSQVFIKPQADFSVKLSTDYEKLLTLLNRKKIDIYELSRGARINFGDGVYLDILYPLADSIFSDINESSFIAYLTFGETGVIFTGDAPKEVERKVLQRDGLNLAAQVLKVSHHGSKTASSKEFLEKVQPIWSIISLGQNNKFGHPHQETINNLKEVNSKILLTSEMGTIKLKSDGLEFICLSCL